MIHIGFKPLNSCCRLGISAAATDGNSSRCKSSMMGRFGARFAGNALGYEMRILGTLHHRGDFDVCGQPLQPLRDPLPDGITALDVTSWVVDEQSVCSNASVGRKRLESSEQPLAVVTGRAIMAIQAELPYASSPTRLQSTSSVGKWSVEQTASCSIALRRTVQKISPAIR